MKRIPGIKPTSRGNVTLSLRRLTTTTRAKQHPCFQGLFRRSRRRTAATLFCVLSSCCSAYAVAGEDTSGTASTALSGEQAFAACAGCHSLGAGEPHKVGPNLHGIVGAPAAAAEGYSYSQALSGSGLTWTRETLFAWIGGSEALVPGSWMLYHNVLSGEEVMNLIAYLERAGQQPPP